MAKAINIDVDSATHKMKENDVLFNAYTNNNIIHVLRNNQILDKYLT